MYFDSRQPIIVKGVLVKDHGTRVDRTLPLTVVIRPNLSPNHTGQSTTLNPLEYQYMESGGDRGGQNRMKRERMSRCRPQEKTERTVPVSLALCFFIVKGRKTSQTKRFVKKSKIT